MVYCIGFICSLLGDAKDHWGVARLLAKSFSMTSEWSFVDGGPALLDVVYMKGEEQSEFRGYRKDYAYLKLFFFRTLLDSMSVLTSLSYVTLLMRQIHVMCVSDYLFLSCILLLYVGDYFDIKENCITYIKIKKF